MLHTEGMDVVKCTVQANGGRVTVGLTGYPNVGKSSTINALFGSEKMAVAPNSWQDQASPDLQHYQ